MGEVTNNKLQVFMAGYRIPSRWDDHGVPPTEKSIGPLFRGVVLRLQPVKQCRVKQLGVFKVNHVAAILKHDLLAFG